VITQANAGLTAALIVGCAAARGEYIARQNCGDRSYPERLSSAKFTRSNDTLAACLIEIDDERFQIGSLVARTNLAQQLRSVARWYKHVAVVQHQYKA